VPVSGLAFEKETDTVSKEILDLFEKTRVAYLSAREDPKEYEKKWKSIVKEIREKFDDIDNVTTELKKVISEKELFADAVLDPKSSQAKTLFSAIKKLRFESELVSDPFSKQLGEQVIDELTENDSILVAFIHYALRSHSNIIPDKAYKKFKLKPDNITQGTIGLDLKKDDLSLYVIEHYGGDKKDTRRVESRIKKGMKLLEEIFVDAYGEEEWAKLVALDIKKEDKKDSIDFIIPNKPMYRIFEIDDMKEILGFSGEYVVQEKYDGMRIQIHKINGKITIYSYNEKDITDKCPEQVKAMEKKQFEDCILDAELILFKGDEALHRADTISHVFKKETEGTLRAHVFDIMRHENKNLTDEPLRERLNILLYQFSPHSSEDLAFPSKKDTRVADSLKEVEEYSKLIMDMPTSEGVVIKDHESTYFIGKKKNPKWIKWKKFIDLDVIVLDKSKTNSNLYSYTMGIGPLNAEDSRKYKTKELDGKEYLPIGKALNTKESVEIGSIIRVKVDEVKKGKSGFSLYSAKVIEIPEVTQTDTLQALEQLSTKTKKSLQQIAELGDTFKVAAGLKKYTITDDIHGTAEIILKQDLDGFTVYGFKGDSLMEKNALYNLDVWKEQVTEITKTKRSELRLAIRNFIFEQKENEEIEFSEIVAFVASKHPDDYEQLFDNEQRKLMNWMKKQDDLIYINPNKFQINADILEKDKDIIKKDTPESGNFNVFISDNDVELLIEVADERMVWRIDLEDAEDVYELFGKSAKYPAKVGKAIRKGKKIDFGKIIFGVQKDGYHEYKLEGEKFETRIHFRVVPIEEQNRWIAWTGKKQEMLDPEDDEGVWIISEDKYADLEFP
tara:strand:- start:1600 stop:4128 length:2529 start_codon:yes stop_codon:yes gene_type:complete